MSPTPRSILLAVMLAALLAGCGGGSNIELEESPAELDAAEASVGYPGDANRICAQVIEQFAAAQTEAPRSFEQAEELLSALSEIAVGAEKALAEITPSPAQADAYQAYLDARGEVVELIGQGLAAAREEDGEAYQRARASVGEGAGERRRLALAAGLRECAAGERG